MSGMIEQGAECIERTAPAQDGWEIAVFRIVVFTFVLSPLGGALAGSITGLVVAITHGIDAASGFIAGFVFGLGTGLLNGIAAAWLVRRKRVVRLTVVLAGGVLIFSLPFMVVPSDWVILASWLAGIAGFWVTLFAEDLGYVDRLLRAVRATTDTAVKPGELGA